MLTMQTLKWMRNKSQVGMHILAFSLNYLLLKKYFHLWMTNYLYSGMATLSESIDNWNIVNARWNIH